MKFAVEVFNLCLIFDFSGYLPRHAVSMTLAGGFLMVLDRAMSGRCSEYFTKVMKLIFLEDG